LKLAKKKLLCFVLASFFIIFENLMTEEQIKHLARLAELQLSEDEIDEMKKEFDAILWFVGRLQQIPTDWVEKMYTPIENVRLDYTRKTSTQVNQEDLLRNSPQEVEDNMIVIKSSTVEH